MSDVEIQPCNLSGEITIPPSKSISHRAIICAALSRGICKIKNVMLSDDVQATINAISALGASCNLSDDVLTVDGRNMLAVENAIIDCDESASTLRFLIPVAATEGVNVCFIGKGKLPSRPIGIYLQCLPKKGVTCECKNCLPLKIKGKLQPGQFLIPGDVSSQFITGLLMALPVLDGDSEIILTSDLESAGYINVTLSVLEAFGIEIGKTQHGYYIKGNQSYKPTDFTVEGDWSQASYFIAAATLSKDPNTQITIKGLNKNSLQGDKIAIDLFSKFGADIKFVGDDLVVRPGGGPIKPIRFDASQAPDIVPTVAFTAMFADGITVICGAYRLKLKECDRLTASSLGINCMGGLSQTESDGIVIFGKNFIKGGIVESYNDHRMIMAMAVTAVRTNNDVVINHVQHVNKSYPTFFEDFNRLGGKADVVDVW